jgi:hypothetical protein
LQCAGPICIHSSSSGGGGSSNHGSAERCVRSTLCKAWAQATS